MNRTITALFDSRDDAERAERKLQDLGVSSVHITGQGQGYGEESGSYAGSSSALTDSPDPVRDVSEGDYGRDQNQDGNRGGGGLWQSLKTMFSDDDRSTYEEGLRRGHFLLTAQVDDSLTDEAIRVLEDSDAVDVDRRAEEWRSAGWTGGTAAAGLGATGLSADDQLTGRAGDDTLRGTTGDDQLSAGSDTLRGTEEHVPVVEERLVVGKREVERGGVRVRSYVRETPVHEQVRLHEEHVEIERRPVNTPLSASNLTSGDLFQERTIEVTERAEEAVVTKEARVVEEVVVRKEAEDRVETVSDTVRRTEVDVDRTEGLEVAGENRAFNQSDDLDVIPGETEEERRIRLANRSGGLGSSSTV